MDWDEVMPLAEKLARQAAGTVAELRKRVRLLPPGMGYGQVHYHPDRQEVWVSVGDWEEDLDRWRKPLEDVEGVKKVTIEAECRPPGIKDGEPWLLIKKAHSPTAGFLAQLGGWLPGPVNDWYGGPSPLAASLASGLLGAGLGYGVGALGEHLLPEEHFQRGRLRKVLALLGWGLATSPALAWGAVSHAANPEAKGLKTLTSNWPLGHQHLQGPEVSSELPRPQIPTRYPETPDYLREPPAYFPEPPPFQGPPDAAPVFGMAADWGPFPKMACEAARELLSDIQLPAHFKKAIYPGYGSGGMEDVPMIPAGPFTQAVWQDYNTPTPIRAATSGLVDSAAAVSRSTLISPFDIARIGIGMGSGYLSGMLVGKTLGALAGLKPESQKSLQQAGTWAGLLTNVVPMIFGG